MPSETKRKNCWEKYATGGASAIRNTVVSAGFQPLWGVKTGTLPRNRLAFFATGGASAIILAFSHRCAILNPSHIQRQSRDLRVAPWGHSAGGTGSCPPDEMASPCSADLASRCRIVAISGAVSPGAPLCGCPACPVCQIRGGFLCRFIPTPCPPATGAAPPGS